MKLLVVYVTRGMDSVTRLFIENLPACDKVLVINGVYPQDIGGCRKIERDDQGSIFDAWNCGIDNSPRDYDGYVLLSNESIGPVLPLWFRDNWIAIFERLLASYDMVTSPGYPFIAIRSHHAPLSIEKLASISGKLYLSDNEACHPIESIFSFPSQHTDEVPLDFDWRMYLYLHRCAREDISEEGARAHWKFHRYPYRSIRTFDQLFRWERYLDKYPDLRQGGIHDERGALMHFFRHGIDEGRTCE
jgi:hypothetical protein